MNSGPSYLIILAVFLAAAYGVFTIAGNRSTAPDILSGVEVTVKVKAVTYNANIEYDMDHATEYTYAKWYIQGSGNSVKLQMETGDVSLTRTYVEEYHSGKKYTYTKPNTTTLLQIYSASDAGEHIVCPPASESNGVSCKAYRNALLAELTASANTNANTVEDCLAPTFAIEHGDVNAKINSAVNVRTLSSGNTLWRIGGFFVEATSGGSPVSIWNDEDDASSRMEIISIKELSSTDHLFKGCNPVTQGGARDLKLASAEHRRLAHNAQTDEEHKAMALVVRVQHEYFTKNKQEAARALNERYGRELSAWNSFQTWASGHQWCGSGTDIGSTACPVWSDDNGDYACHRHDHGKKANGIIGGYAVRLGCDIDRGLADRTSNWAAQAVFGSWGIAQMWGCYDHGSYSCWNWVSKWWGGWWRYGYYCHGEHTHYGPWRYGSYSHSYGWTQQSRCYTPLPFCKGCI